MSNLTLYKNDEPRPEVDEVLHDYFQSQMPKPWPAFKAPKAMRTRETPSLWARYRGRIALAACVALLIAGYWSVSGDGANQPATGLPRVGPSIGLNPKDGKAAHQKDEALVPNGPNPKAK